jgi:hypothetical protein
MGYVIVGYLIVLLCVIIPFLVDQTESLIYDQTESPILSKSKIYDQRFYYLSLMRESVEDGSRYGIHGLWPQNSKTKYPSFCKDVDFDYDVLKPILPELEEYWYSSRGLRETISLGIKDSGSNEKFWSHEWKKHGSCMFSESNINSELEYFQKTLEVYHKAVKIDLPMHMGCKETCMIPVSLDFSLILSRAVGLGWNNIRIN